MTFLQFLTVLIVVSILAPIGGSLLSIIEFRMPLPDIFDSASGSTHLGGYFLALPAVILFALWRKIPLLKMLDAVTLSWVAGYAIGRLACFFSGDGCYGIDTSSFLGMTFPNGIEPTSMHVYPTPLFESAYALIIFGVFYWLYARKGAHAYTPGRIFFGASSWMFLCRFAVEFIRRNPKYGWFTLTQWACIPFCLSYSTLNFFLPLNGKSASTEIPDFELQLQPM